ncbi:MAG TPA: DUF1570 domain-containing protein [Phycisphaerae bacterium]|nr:DUF1570 domain-containing protein [Phycisphaerae bacterium]HNU46823.1 DUF1570 domain-containing protein [Phycisphaerae bacterium]
MRRWAGSVLRRRGAARWSPVLLLLVGGCAGGKIDLFTPKVSAQVEEWDFLGQRGRRIVTDHFEVYSTIPDKELEEALPTFLETAYRQYVATVPPGPAAEQRLQTYIFGSRRDWMGYTRMQSPHRAPVYSKIRQGGYTEGSTSVLFYTTRSATLATLAHEGWHQYAGSRFPNRLPPWLEEGLACYHESFYYEGSRPQFTPRHNTLRINSLREAVQRGNLFPLRQIINTDAGQVILDHQARDTQVYYAQTWALVTFLRHGRYAGAFSELLRDFAAGALPAAAGAARLTGPDPVGTSYGEAVFYAYFGTDLDRIEREYQDHLARVAGF